jgi:hypothetical protein
MQELGGVRKVDGRSSRVKARAMTLLEIFKIEREVAENPPLPGLTVRRIPASNPDHISLVLEWPQGDKTRSHEVREFYDYHDWKLRVESKAI